MRRKRFPVKEGHRYYFGWIEEPFPWLPILVIALPAVLIGFAICLGLCW